MLVNYFLNIKLVICKPGHTFRPIFSLAVELQILLNVYAGRRMLINVEMAALYVLQGTANFSSKSSYTSDEKKF